MFVHFSKDDVEKIINNDSIVYAQIPFIHHDYFDFESETAHLLTLEINSQNARDTGSYFEGYYPFVRKIDLDTFESLINKN